MKRQQYRAAIWDGHTCLAERTTCEHNSAIETSEELAREYARAQGITAHGGHPQWDGEVYQRIWRGPGAWQICATVVPFVAQ